MDVNFVIAPASLALLAKMGDGVKPALLDGMNRTLIAAENQSKILAPVDTGRLRASIAHEAAWSGDSLIGAWGTNIAPHYAPDVEYGTKAHFPPPGALARWAARHGFKSGFAVARAIAKHGTKAHPFLKPVLESPFLRTIFTYQFTQAIENWWRKIGG